MSNHESVEEHESLMHEAFSKIFGEQASDEPKTETILEIYHQAYHLYRDQDYAKAANLFRVLTVVNPLEAKYWKALGACSHMLQDYEHAIRCYICTQALYKDQPDPYLYVHAADCYFSIGQIEQGLMALEGAQHRAEEQQDEKILRHVALMKEQWSRKNN